MAVLLLRPAGVRPANPPSPGRGAAIRSMGCRAAFRLAVCGGMEPGQELPGGPLWHSFAANAIDPLSPVSIAQMKTGRSGPNPANIPAPCLASYLSAIRAVCWIRQVSVSLALDRVLGARHNYSVRLPNPPTAGPWSPPAKRQVLLIEAPVARRLDSRCREA
jgi:hypothetical protein